MNKLYFIFPIVALAVFFGFYMNARNGIEAAAAARAVQQQKDQEERQRKELEARQKAWDEAKAQAEQRIAEYNARLAKEKEQAAQTEAATAERQIAFREKENLSKQKLQLEADIATVKEQKNKVDDQLKIQRTQVDYLQTSAKDVAQTKASFQTALDKLDNAEKAFAVAEQQRAAAAARTTQPRSN